MIYYNSSYIYVSGVKLFKLSSSNDNKYNVAVTTLLFIELYLHHLEFCRYEIKFQFLIYQLLLFCRFRAERLRKEADQLPRSKVVPAVEYLRSSRLPADDADTSVVFLCRQVYDFKLKRILKNPS